MKQTPRLALLPIAACAILACNTPDAGDEASPDLATSDLTSSRQLMGSNMAAGSFALTFDDGPSARTEELAHWLADRGIVATFFINGKNARGRESALAAIVNRGHILANHTHDHVDMQTLWGGALYSAVADTDAIIRAYQPNGPWLLRAPFGFWDSRISSELNASDMGKYVGSIYWNVGGELTAQHGADWACWSQGYAVGDCAWLYMNEMRARGRGIVLLHDAHSATVDMTKIIVERMAHEARFVSIMEAPDVAAAVNAGGGGQWCDSATLGEWFAPGTCVRSGSDGEWYRCNGGGAQDWGWIRSPASDVCTACPQKPAWRCE